MTLLSRLLSWFPAAVLGLAGVSFFLLHHSPWGILALLFTLYGLPVIAYHIHQSLYPIHEGISYIGQDYSPWWGSHQIQSIYIAIPALESTLRLVPGLFSLWLRLWGSKIGKSIYWTPGLEIADRGLLEIGDRVIFGHRVGIYSHVIKPKKQDLLLYVKKVRIGHDVFLGAGSHLGPGSLVQDGSYLPAATNLYPNQVAES